MLGVRLDIIILVPDLVAQQVHFSAGHAALHRRLSNCFPGNPIVQDQYLFVCKNCKFLKLPTPDLVPPDVVRTRCLPL